MEDDCEIIAEALPGSPAVEWEYFLVSQAVFVKRASTGTLGISISYVNPDALPPNSAG